MVSCQSDSEHGGKELSSLNIFVRNAAKKTRGAVRKHRERVCTCSNQHAWMRTGSRHAVSSIFAWAAVRHSIPTPFFRFCHRSVLTFSASSDPVEFYLACVILIRLLYTGLSVLGSLNVYQKKHVFCLKKIHNKRNKHETNSFHGAVVCTVYM